MVSSILQLHDCIMHMNIHAYLKYSYVLLIVTQAPAVNAYCNTGAFKSFPSHF